MKFKCTRSISEVLRDRRIARNKRNREWQERFAWWPVKLGHIAPLTLRNGYVINDYWMLTGDCVWLEMVQRRKEHSYCDWDYREIPAANNLLKALLIG